MKLTIHTVKPALVTTSIITCIIIQVILEVVTKAGLTVYIFIFRKFCTDSKQASYIWPVPWSYNRTTGL